VGVVAVVVAVSVVVTSVNGSVRYGRGFANGSRTQAITELQNWRAGLVRVIVGRRIECCTVVCVDLRSVDWSECYKINEELMPGWSLLSSMALWLWRDSRLATRGISMFLPPWFTNHQVQSDCPPSFPSLDDGSHSWS
jgi:hypothetical protein